MQLGTGSRSIAQAGCLLTSLTLAARALTPNTTLSVTGAHALILAAHGFLGSALDVPRACQALGFRLAARAAFERGALAGELSAGRPVVLGIDYRPGHSSGFSDADHFVLALGLEGGALTYIDPARGARERLSLAGVRYRDKPAQLCEMLFFAPLPQ